MEKSQRSESANEADLTKGMEHMRFYVSVPAGQEAKKQEPLRSEDQGGVHADGSRSGNDVYGVPACAIQPHRKTTAIRSTNLTPNPQKRSDPFQFGSRYLTENDDIFEFNAWDHVEVDDAFKSFAEEQFLKQRENPASAYHQSIINSHPEKPWNRFYSNNSSNFFKDRKWLFQEFPILERATGNAEDSSPQNAVRILEVGAGAGNTAFPMLAVNKNPGLHIHAVDFSEKAIDVIKTHPSYDARHLSAEVWDLVAANEDGGASLPADVPAGSIDIVIMIFVFSALEPAQWRQALSNVWAALKPGGEVLFRDYGRGDLAQVRFKKGKWMGDNFYVRGDGTRVYFFEEAELEAIWSKSNKISSSNPGSEEVSDRINDPTREERDPRFEIVNLATDRRLLVNRQRKLKMYRCWMQGKFRKPVNHREGRLRT